jgi:hypothetical protein
VFIEKETVEEISLSPFQFPARAGTEDIPEKAEGSTEWMN